MIVQKITKNISINKKGELLVFWENGKKNILPDIDTAIRQNLHIIEGYYGIKLNLGKKKIFLKGEKEKIASRIKNLQRIISKLIRDPRNFSSSIKDLKDAQKELQNSVNQYKKKSKEKIDNAKKILDVGEANLELIKRIEEIQKISEGVTKRTEKLIEEKRRIEKIFSITYKRLFLFLEETQANITKKRLEEIADEICGGKINLFNGLKSIKVMPYLKRVNSYEIRRLEKLEIYLKNNKEDMFLRAIENAIKKMRPIIKEINQRKKIKTGSLF